MLLLVQTWRRHAFSPSDDPGKSEETKILLETPEIFRNKKKKNKNKNKIVSSEAPCRAEVSERVRYTETLSGVYINNNY